jgi:membrane associated rhomboid family serine protease
MPDAPDPHDRDPHDRDPHDRDPLHRLPDAMVLAMIAVYCGIEAVLQGADHRLWGSVLWRPLAYQYGGFWAGLMRGGWLANYPGQTGAMFVTHSFLHAGLSHLLGNMITLAALANLLAGRMGRAEFAALWLLSAVAGGFVFGLLGPASQPMVGTSGALFGLVGLLLVREAQARRADGASRLSVLATVLAWLAGLAALNLGFWWLQNGILAWQAHLGGFLMGLAWGLVGLARGQPRLAKTRS